VGVRTTLDDEMLTTSGNTDFTMGAKPVLLGPSFGSANFNDACILLGSKFWLARANPKPAKPKTKSIANVAACGFWLNLEPFILSPPGDLMPFLVAASAIPGCFLFLTVRRAGNEEVSLKRSGIRTLALRTVEAHKVAVERVIVLKPRRYILCPVSWNRPFAAGGMRRRIACVPS
jgi:hypothetical protein